MTPAREFVPLAGATLERLGRLAARELGEATIGAIAIDPADLRDLVAEVQRHRAIAAALVSDEPDSRFDAGIVAARRSVFATVKRNLEPQRSALRRLRAALASSALECRRDALRFTDEGNARFAAIYDGKADGFDCAIAALDVAFPEARP